MSSIISLDALKVLDAIDKKGSFAAAAESLYRVPSALTYTVQKLEQDLGSKLFERQGTRSILTDAGQLVLAEGREILAAAQRLENAVRQLETGWETSISLALDTVLADGPLLTAIAKFTELGKQVTINVSKEALGGGWDALYSKRADIAIGVSGELPRGQYELEQIATVEFVFAVASHHPLAQRKGIVPMQALLDYPAVVVADSSQALSQRSSGLFASRQVIRVSSMPDKIAMQQQGIGVGFLPKHLIQTALQTGNLIAREVEQPREALPLYMAWRKGEQGKALAWFVERLRNSNWSLGL
ncbi:LysR family transcriptional regulator [Shewanella mangrovi]|uniref:LysR family transcriptional regulator n=1 Tax=Shewanella mangrovi TaxID=1515746 RepID=A0A094K0E8_9GAMM|nr:LysR substrate-binding domain-containing protein [Shewanella mangrovi]KFZ38146.1 LysR family transcriptional regulator [Shewanella mangrovi]